MSTPTGPSVAAPVEGLDAGTLNLMLEALGEFVAQELPDKRMLELDHEDECPEDTVRAMCSDELGIQLVFIPEEYGGMGGGAFDVYRVCERMARFDLGLGTSVFATFLGSDPILVGGTPGAEEALARPDRRGGHPVRLRRDRARGRQRPRGDDHGCRACRRRRQGRSRLPASTDASSGSATAASPTPTASSPSRPVGRRGSSSSAGPEGLPRRRPRTSTASGCPTPPPCSSTTSTSRSDHLVGGVEGQGLVQAQQVFGYTRLMVAAFGLGGGWAALDRAIRYSTERIQAGTPLSEKQGYTHKLIVPHVVRLEAARAFVEETAVRIDAGEGAEGALNTEGAIAKYLATEAGVAAADAAIQAHGGYGYTRDYIVEKIQRDVRITTIYEGTSEIMEMTIARDRWQQHLKTRGEYYLARAASSSPARRASRGRRRRRGPGHASAWPGCWRPAGRSPHPQPARPAPPR